MIAAGVVFASVAVAAWLLLTGARPWAAVGHDRALRLLLGGFAAVAGFAFTRLPAACLAGMLAGWYLPARHARLRQTKRGELIDHQLAELLRSWGHGLAASGNATQALVSGARRVAPPLRDEVDVLVRSLPCDTLEREVEAFARRLGTMESRHLAEAVSIGAATGGSLGKTLELLARDLDARQEARSKLRARTDSARRQTVIVSLAMPVIMTMLVLGMGPALTDFYRGVAGTIVLVVAGALTLFAARWIARLGGGAS